MLCEDWDMRAFESNNVGVLVDVRVALRGYRCKVLSTPNPNCLRGTFLDFCSKSYSSTATTYYSGLGVEMVDVKDLLAYNDAERRAFFKAFTKLSWDDFTKDREASFGSIKNIFIHTLNATDYWLDFLQKEDQCSKKKFEKYKTLKEIGTYMRHVEKRMNKYIQPLSLEDLKKKYTGKRKGKPETITAEDILVHVFEEEVHHRGELIALFWQMGIKPPLIGYPP